MLLRCSRCGQEQHFGFLAPICFVLSLIFAIMLMNWMALYTIAHARMLRLCLAVVASVVLGRAVLAVLEQVVLRRQGRKACPVCKHVAWRCVDGAAPASTRVYRKGGGRSVPTPSPSQVTPQPSSVSSSKLAH